MIHAPPGQARATPLEQATSASRRVGIPSHYIVLALFALFALDTLLVSVFLGRFWILAITGVAATVLLIALNAGERHLAGPQILSWRTLAACFAIAAIILVLGGEGHFLYANEDWQVRDAVLADITRNPWPFAYPTAGGTEILRAPLGMYLLPALIAKSVPIAADHALLVCNTVMLGLLFALGGTLFTAGRSRRIALILFVAFSGLDIVGTVFATVAGGSVSFDHLERWAPPLQYSSVVTLLFWVPQHAMAGWFCALLYLLHRSGNASLGAVAAAVPIAAIWSPLAVMGAVPFVLWSAMRTLRHRALRWTDFAAGVAAVGLSLPALGYLAAGAGQLPSGIRGLPAVTLAEFLLLEVVPSLWIVLRVGAVRRFGLDSLALATGMLVLIPFFHIGTGWDLVMRASIPSLAILAAFVIAGLVDTNAPIPRPVLFIVVTLLALGAVTGASEVARSLRLAPTPPPRCTLVEMWPRQSGWVADLSTYVAPAEAMPEFLRPRTPALLAPPAAAGRACWSRGWQTPRSGSAA